MDGWKVMANPKTYKASFSGGEISPEMVGRIDDAKYQQGASSLENMIASALGPAEKRPGFQFVKATKGNGIARLIPFQFSTTQTFVVEVGEGYFRFHTIGETLLYNPSQPVFIPSSLVTFTVAGPTVVTWGAHGLTSGDQVQFFNAALPIPNQMPAGVGALKAYVITVVDADHFTMVDPVTSTPVAVTAAPVGLVIGYPYHVTGDLISFGVETHYYVSEPPYGFPDNNPDTDGFWYLLPADLTYEIPNIYAAADIFSIHYVQSNDVVTMVHPNYPPSELRRLGATLWTFTPIVFGPLLLPPTNVAIAAHPGYKAVIQSASGSPSTITTVSNHTLALGDPVYLSGTSSQDGFYLVASVPIVSGNLVPNELLLMDLSGNNVTLTGTYVGATLQFGSQIFNITNFYVVTTIAPDSIQQSAISAEVSVLNNLNVTGSFNTITWTTAAGAFRYYIYKKLNGLYGYIGETPAQTTVFNDNNIAPDFSITPPIYDTVFNSDNEYPAAVTYFQQRRAFAGTNTHPQNLWMSKTGTESDFSYSLPIKDTDRIAIQIAARQQSSIEHMLPLNQLLLLTNSSEISVSPTNSDTITPTTISARPQSYIGANNVQPTITNTTAVYCADRGGHVREIGYQFTVGGYITGDVSLRASHLFDNLAILDQAYMKAPYQIVWFVSSGGNLLGFTYIPEEQVGAWHHHVTDGIFESVACVAEGIEDRLYAVIRRIIDGVTVRYIERMSTHNFDAIQDCFYVDSGATYDGTNTSSTVMSGSAAFFGPPLGGAWQFFSAPGIFSITDLESQIVIEASDGNIYRFTVIQFIAADQVYCVPTSTVPNTVGVPATASWAWARPSVGGLTWLEGKTVAILADGAVQPSQIVTGGVISIQYPSTLITIGLPFAPTFGSLPLAMQVEAFGQGVQKNINKVWVRVYRSSGIFAGYDPANLKELKQRTTEPYGTPPNLLTDVYEIVIPSSWNPDGRVYITQNDPLPLTIAGLTIEASVGG